MLFDQTLIDTLRRRADLLTIVRESGVSLTKHGWHWRASCPFHPELRNSFVIYRGKKFFYCKGCSRCGDVFDYVRLSQGLSFDAAVRFLQARIRRPVYARKTMPPPAPALPPVDGGGVV